MGYFIILYLNFCFLFLVHKLLYLLYTFTFVIVLYECGKSCQVLWAAEVSFKISEYELTFIINIEITLVFFLYCKMFISFELISMEFFLFYTFHLFSSNKLNIV